MGVKTETTKIKFDFRIEPTKKGIICSVPKHGHQPSIFPPHNEHWSQSKTKTFNFNFPILVRVFQICAGILSATITPYLRLGD